MAALAAMVEQRVVSGELLGGARMGGVQYRAALDGGAALVGGGYATFSGGCARVEACKCFSFVF